MLGACRSWVSVAVTHCARYVLGTRAETQEDVMPTPEAVRHPLYTQEGREATPAAL